MILWGLTHSDFKTTNYANYTKASALGFFKQQGQLKLQQGQLFIGADAVGEKIATVV